MKLKALVGTGIAAGALAISSIAGAAVTFDPDTGTGFVGKGDVQLAFGWNNAQLQQSASGVTFRYEATSTEVTEVSWECTNSKNEKVQERERSTTTESSISGVVSGIARDKKHQITGFNLMGYSGTPATTSSVETDGPKVDSCPDDSGNWSLTSPAGEPTVVSSTTTGGLYVTHNSVSHQLVF